MDEPPRAARACTGLNPVAGLTCSVPSRVRTEPRDHDAGRSQLTMTCRSCRPIRPASVPAIAAGCTRSAAWLRSSDRATRGDRGPGQGPRRTRSARARDGFDGTWVIRTRTCPDRHRDPPSGVLGSDRTRNGGSLDEVSFRAADLPSVCDRPRAPVTEAGLRSNIASPGLSDSWLRGVGAAAIDNLMAGLRDCGISRSQLWLWVTPATTLEDGGS